MSTLKQYLAASEKDERADFAKRCGTTLGHLQNVAYGVRLPSAELSAAIERESGKAVTRRDLHPETWQLIWPELAEPEAKGA